MGTEWLSDKLLNVSNTHKFGLQALQVSAFKIVASLKEDGIDGANPNL